MQRLGNWLNQPLEISSLGGLAMLALLIVSPLAQAGLSDDVIGSYSGNVTYSEVLGSPGPCNGAELAQMDLEITQLATNSFKGTGTLTLSDGVVQTLILNISGTTPTKFGFGWTLDVGRDWREFRRSRCWHRQPPQ